jgi:hypothetical protein
MPPQDAWHVQLERWTTAGVIDADTAARIRAFEEAHAPATRLRWPVRLALAFGGLLLGASVLLFVSSQWDMLSPAVRFTLLLVMVGALHGLGAAAAMRSPGLSETLHALGTIALGGGVFLAGQIFNLEEHWPAGVMLWAAGAWLGVALLGGPAQLAIAVLLTPVWLGSEWLLAAGGSHGIRVLGVGVFLLALAYLTAPIGPAPSRPARVLAILGAIALLPACALLWEATEGWLSAGAGARPLTAPAPSTATMAVGWLVALAGPLLVALAFRRGAWWMNAAAAGWALAAVFAIGRAPEWTRYGWFALGAIALAGWGVRESRSERINLASALFAITVLAFYFAQVMDRLGRSLSLAGLGVLFLAGGWMLERTRRQLITGASGAGR